jgi:hypothetical protein
VFRCPRAPFSISLSHYFSFRLKRSLVAARNTKEKINLRKRGWLLSHAHHKYRGAFMLATVLTPMSANGIQCNHPSAAWISQFSAYFSKRPTNKKQTNKKQTNKKQTRAKWTSARRRTGPGEPVRFHVGSLLGRAIIKPAHRPPDVRRRQQSQPTNAQFFIGVALKSHPALNFAHNRQSMRPACFAPTGRRYQAIQRPIM